MIPYIGDFVEDDIVYVAFNTFTSDDPSASCTITNFANTDVHIHKDDGLTQRNNAAGITVSVDFDSITGSHMLKIDTSDNTVAGFWVAGHDYFVRIEGTTVDAATINSMVAHFSIENRFMRGTDSANTTVPDAAGVAPTVGEIRTEMEGAGTKLSEVLTDTGTTLPGRFTGVEGASFATGTDSLEAVRNRGDAAWTTGAGGSDRLLMVDTTIATLASQTSFTLNAGSADNDAYNNCTIIIEDASTAVQKAVGIVSAYTGATRTVTLKYDPNVFTITTTDKVYILAENALKATLANRQLNVAADGDIAGNVDGSVASLVGHTAQTGDNFGRLGAPAGASVSADLVAIDGYVDNLESRLTSARAGYLDNLSAGAVALASVCTNTRLLELDTVNLPTDVANIPTVAQIRTEMDTNSTKMAPSQVLADYKATGFSTHGAADIWSVGTRTITDKAGFSLLATGANLIPKDSTFALAMADAIWDEILTGATHNIATSAGKKLRQLAAFAIHGDTAQTGNATTITLAATASGDDGVYNRNLISIAEGTGAGQTRQIADYNGTSKVASVDREWRVQPDATSVYQITADNVFALVDQGLAVAATSTTITLRPYASTVNDTYLCNQVAIIAGTGRGQCRLIGSYNGTTKVATICGDNWVTIPDATSTYVLLPYGTTCTSCVGTHALGQINTECDTALTDYDPPTRTEATSDKAAIITEVDANETKIDALNNISVADIIAGVSDGALDLQEMMRIILAATAGKSTGGGTVTLTFRDSADSKARITATVDASGNRTAMTLDGA